MQNVTISDQCQTGGRPGFRADGPCPVYIRDGNGECLFVGVTITIVGLDTDAVTVLRLIVKHCIGQQLIVADSKRTVVA